MKQEQYSATAIGRIDGENLIFSQSWWNQVPLLLGFLVLTGSMGYLTFLFPGYTIASISIGSKALVVPYLFLIPLILLLKAAYKVYNQRFVLTPEYMIHITGRISWRERSVRLEYSRIQEIEIVHTLLQRLFRLGDVIIIPLAGTIETQVQIVGVASPRAVKDEIRRRQNRG